MFIYVHMISDAGCSIHCFFWCRAKAKLSHEDFSQALIWEGLTFATALFMKAVSSVQYIS